MHMLSAFASEIGIAIGQLKVDGKTNEITEIPKLLDILDVEGATITIDSIGCQTKIVEKILQKKAHYVVGLKGNQGTLHDDVKLLFDDKPSDMEFFSFETIEKGHGRIEKRKCTVTQDIDWLREQHSRWKGLSSIVEIESTREIKEKISIEKRYYISSHKAEPAILNNVIRQHWGIENKLHWVLDICFGDDQSRIRKGNAPSNMAVIKKTAINLLQIIKRDRPRISLKRMRKMAGWDNDFLDIVLMAQF
jgi:predicted transposase YbfD/YdcC